LPGGSSQGDSSPPRPLQQSGEPKQGDGRASRRALPLVRLPSGIAGARALCRALRAAALGLGTLVARPAGGLRAPGSHL